MDGMLIFVGSCRRIVLSDTHRPKSGLYSASLTAFLIESYKTLSPDSGDATVAVLMQMSRQLAAISNGAGDAMAFQDPVPFQPTAASFLCNVLWFLSLALSLTCALLATLVEQWARDFLHKTEMRPSAVHRARVFSFLYFGLKKFGMHTVVDVIPMLLHASLFFFFAGPLGFLLPVNHILMYLMEGVLAIFLILYVILTGLPVIFLDFPYRTPLSALFWRLLQRFHGPRNGCSPESYYSLTEAIVEGSLRRPLDRDDVAICRTVSSLTDDSELLPFVEAIPDVIHGPKGLRSVNDHLLFSLLQANDPHILFVNRILDLLRNSNSPWVDQDLRHRRQTACFKATMSIAWMLNARSSKSSVPSSRRIFWFDMDILDALNAPNIDCYFSIPARAVVRYSWLNSLQDQIGRIQKLLQDCEPTSESSQRRVLHSASKMIAGVAEYEVDWPSQRFKERFRQLKDIFATSLVDLDVSTLYDIHASLNEVIKKLADDARWAAARIAILGDFLRASIQVGTCPYQYSADS